MMYYSVDSNKIDNDLKVTINWNVPVEEEKRRLLELNRGIQSKK